MLYAVTNKAHVDLLYISLILSVEQPFCRTEREAGSILGLIYVTSFMNGPKGATHISELFFQAVMESFLSQSLETGLNRFLFV